VTFEPTGEPVDPAWYPDVAADGDLASALRRVAGDIGVDLGQLIPMTLNVRRGAALMLDDGSVKAETVAGERAFAVFVERYLAHPDVEAAVSAHGKTADLPAVVRAADAWRRGVKLEELREAFPFMVFSPKDLARERGAIREYGWDMLLRMDSYAPFHPLLEAARADEQLGRLWVTGSHTYWLYLTPHPKSPVVVRVHLVDSAFVIGPGGGWEDGPGSRPSSSVPEALAAIKELLLQD
jgi:hypothetical protein